jgi:hypothetical protein
MRGQPTTSISTVERPLRESLSEQYRSWRAQPRRTSRRLYWGLVGFGVVLDTFTAGLFVCLLTLPVSTATAGQLADATEAAGLWPAWTARRASWCSAFLAVLLLAGGWALPATRARCRHFLHCTGLCCAGGSLAAAAVSLGASDTSKLWPCWVGFLAAACAVTLEITYRRGILVLAGSVVAGLLFLVADVLPPRYVQSLLSVTPLIDGYGWQLGRGLTLLAGAGAIALAWGLGSLTLVMILADPQRRSVMHNFSGGTYRALALAVLLLAGSAILGGMPSSGPMEIATLAALLGFAFLLHARFAGWVQDLGLALGCVAGGLVAAIAALQIGVSGEESLSGPAVRLGAWSCCAAAVNASLAVHAARRYWFNTPYSR